MNRQILNMHPPGISFADVVIALSLPVPENHLRIIDSIKSICVCNRCTAERVMTLFHARKYLMGNPERPLASEHLIAIEILMQAQRNLIDIFAITENRQHHDVIKVPVPRVVVTITEVNFPRKQ